MMVRLRYMVCLLILVSTAGLICLFMVHKPQIHRNPQHQMIKSDGQSPSTVTEIQTHRQLRSGASDCDTSVSKRFECRNQVVRNICSKEDVRGSVGLVAGHTPANVSLCVVPKAACTQWLGLFRFLANQDSSNKTLSAYSKYDIHVGPERPYMRYKFNGPDKDYIRKTVRVMTTRNPYTRLWSAYVDKLWLPDFWKAKGIQIIKMVRDNATSSAKRCGHDVTFSEFLQYVINLGHEMTFWELDYHWLPVTDICNPCKFSPQFIMQQETFISDYKFILNKVGLLHFVEPTLSADPDEIEIANEIDYAFRIYPSVNISCISKHDLIRRIWTAMIYNGYLQSDDEFPNGVVEETLDVSSVVKLVIQARRNHHSNSSSKQANRKKILREMYGQIPSHQLQALRELYKLDFEMFGYNSSPPI